MQCPYPSFSNLPVDKSGPRGNAWGLWGPDDQLGTLNHLTDKRVRDACRDEVRTGERVSLKYVAVSYMNSLLPQLNTCMQLAARRRDEPTLPIPT